MSDETVAKIPFLPKYELVPENYHVLQSLVFSRAHTIRKEAGVGKGRAQILAEDDIARSRVKEAVDGAKLSSWLSSTRMALGAQNANGRTGLISDPIKETPAIAKIGMPQVDNDDFPVKGRRVNLLFKEFMDKLRPMKKNDVWSFPTTSLEESDRLNKFLPRVARELGWRVGMRAKSYQSQSLPDRLKIKRL